jgi:two-component system invasion response regulator UvrY
MAEILKILIAEDEGIIGEALCFLVNSFNGMKAIGLVTNGEEALRMAGADPPDVILMDIKMPVIDGVEATRIIRKKYPQIRIIALTSVTDGKLVTDALSAGVDGFVIKKGPGTELQTAILSVIEGRRYICSEAAIIIADSYLAEKQKGINPFTHVTRVEREMLELICLGMSASEIAKKLSISKKTVEKYRDNLRLKTGTGNVAELAAAYIKHKNEKT